MLLFFFFLTESNDMLLVEGNFWLFIYIGQRNTPTGRYYLTNISLMTLLGSLTFKEKFNYLNDTSDRLMIHVEHSFIMSSA